LRRAIDGTVLLAVALLDDIGGLVIAGILAQLAAYGTAEAGAIPWYIIVRPIFVSFGFAFGVPCAAVGVRWVLERGAFTRLRVPEAQLFVLVVMLSGFVAGSKYAGTSELFGAYLAGAFLAHVFTPSPNPSPPEDVPGPMRAFQQHIAPLLQAFLSPFFLASIGSVLPIRSFGAVNGSHRGVWRGLSMLMGLTKAARG
ncbi:hypothetical protein FB451DRAFT_980217, partial [Mycena latifolia]